MKETLPLHLDNESIMRLYNSLKNKLHMNMVKKSIVVLVSLFIYATSFAQDPLFTIEEKTIDKGDTVLVNVTTDNFTDIVAFQWSHNFDSTILELVDFVNLNSELGGILYFGPEAAGVENGEIRVNWFDSQTNPRTIADGSILYTMRYVAIGNECDTSAVIFSDDPLDIQVLDTNLDEIDSDFEHGEVAINGTDCTMGGGPDDVVIKVSSGSGDNGTEICLNVQVEDFANIAAMQFTMNWDPAIITFNRVQNFNLTNLNQGSFSNNNPGELLCVWDDGGQGAQSLPNNTTIFQICFNIVGTSGQMSDVRFTDSPLKVEFTDDDSNTVGHRTSNGKVTVTGNTGGGETTLTLGNVSGENDGDDICIPLSVKDFTDVGTMQWRIEYDPELTYTGPKNFNLTNLSAGSIFSPSVGHIRCVWEEGLGGCVSAPDNDIIVELCFSRTGQPCPKTYDIIFVPAGPPKLELTDCDGNDISTTTVNGTIEVKCDTMQPNLMVTDTTVAPSNCHDKCRGYVEVFHTGGTGPFEYMWTRTDTVPVTPVGSGKAVNGVCPGTYSVKVTDTNNGDMVTLTNIVVMNPDELILQNVQIDPATNGNNGKITATMAGGTPPYSFVWEDCEGNRLSGNGNMLSDLMKGCYKMTVFDSKNCVYGPDTLIVPGQPIVIDGNPSVTHVKCFGDCDGAIDISVTGGCGPYTYMWSGPSGGNLNETAEDQTGLCAGKYTVVVRDSVGAETMLMITVDQPDELVINLDDIINGTSGSILVTVEGGIKPYTFMWTNNAGSVGSTEDLTNVPPDTYTLKVTDARGCMTIDSFTITIEDLEVDVTPGVTSGGTDISCNGVCDGSFTVIVSKGSGNYTYMWSPNTVSGANPTGLCAGTYTLTVTDNVRGTQKVVGPYTLVEPDPIVIDSIQMLKCADRDGDPGAVGRVHSSGGTTPYNYLWCDNTMAQVAQNLIGGTTCNVLVTDANGCQVLSPSFEVCIDPDGGNPPCDTCSCYEGSKAMTPNGDAFNEYLIINCIDDYPNELFIFNRWGQQVNSFVNYDNDWNGLDEDGEEVTEDVYMWVLKVAFPDGRDEVYRGTVTLRRY